MIDHPPKIIIIGVGNSGTKLLGRVINELLIEQGYPLYYYEPLYWMGTKGEKDIKLNLEGIQEHKRFPLYPDANVKEWPWLDKFITNLEGLAKFIRIGSRIRLLKKHPVKIIWITRELYSYLASVQKNFPRCLPDAGWHHRPGQYDDYEKLKRIYSDFDLRKEEEYRIEIEAAWWHHHNSQVFHNKKEQSICHIKYEDLCQSPPKCIVKVAEFIGIPFLKTKTLKEIYAAPERNLTLSPRNIWMIEFIAGGLNRELYSLT